ncbi:MAG: hypothetical protein R2862_04705 [Thermoanaerobaculia bacterium]
MTDVVGAAAFVNRWARPSPTSATWRFSAVIWRATARPGRSSRPRRACADPLARSRTRRRRARRGRHPENSWTGETRTIAPAPTALLIARLIEAVAPARILDLTATALLPVSELGQAALDHPSRRPPGCSTSAAAGSRRSSRRRWRSTRLSSGESGDEIERQLALIFGSEAPLATIRALQAGLFHGIGASLTFRLDEDLTSAALRKRLARSSRLKPGATRTSPAPSMRRAPGRSCSAIFTRRSGPSLPVGDDRQPRRGPGRERDRRRPRARRNGGPPADRSPEFAPPARNSRRHPVVILRATGRWFLRSSARRPPRSLHTVE